MNLINKIYLQNPLKIYLFTLLVLAGTSLAVQADAEVQGPDQAGTIAAELKSIIATRHHPGLLSGDFTNRAENVAQLYELAGHQLIWFADDQSLQQNRLAIDLLKRSEANALSPKRYELSYLEENLGAVRDKQITDARHLAVFDTAMSIEMLRYMYDLRFGRVDPQGMQYNLGLHAKKVDLPELLLEHLKNNKLLSINASLEPQNKQYQRLKLSLADYRKLASTPGLQNFILPTPFKVGKKHKQIPQLREFLTFLGDYRGASQPESAMNFSLQDSEAVKNFQLRHGLPTTGVINRETLAELNVPLSERIKKIELAMERLRWMPEKASESGLLVNIPAFHLWAVNADGEVDESQLSMRVVVGEAQKNETPVLSAEMQYLDFMPHWNIPQSIVNNEILEKLERNGNYLNAQNMEIVPSFDKNATAVAFNKSLLEDLRKGALKIRQRPGKGNALGKVKFIFPNSYNVYLHDTPAGALFKKWRRDFSHGCVRVEDPLALAEFVLHPQAKWNRAAIKKAMIQGNEQRVYLPKTLPVTIFYTTAFFDQPDRLKFYPDIYGYDQVLQAALAKPGEVADSSLFIQQAASEVPEEANLTQ